MGRRKHFDKKATIRRKATREDCATWRLTHLLAGSHALASTAPSVSRNLMRTGQQIGKRINMTMDCVTVKRHVCKKCNTLLLPTGPTPMRVRISPRRQTHVVITCGHCAAFRRFPASRLNIPPPADRAQPTTITPVNGTVNPAGKTANSALDHTSALTSHCDLQ